MSASNTAETTASVRSSKRKRDRVSYLADEYFDELDLPEAKLDEDDSEAEEDSDGQYGRKRTAKKPAKKKAKRAPKAKKVKPFRFLDLSAELRNQIYEQCLTEPDGLTLVSRTRNRRRCIERGPINVSTSDEYYGKQRRRGRWWGLYHRAEETAVEHNDERSLMPNLLAVNRQIHEEAIGYLYQQEIIFEDTKALHLFLASIGPDNRQVLTDLTLRGWGYGRGMDRAHNFAALTMLQGCTSLQTLFFDCTLGSYLMPAQLAGQIYRDGHFFLESFGTAHGSYDAAVDVLEFSDWHFDKHRKSRYVRREGNPEPEFDQKKRDDFEQELRRLLAKGAKR